MSIASVHTNDIRPTPYLIIIFYPSHRFISSLVKLSDVDVDEKYERRRGASLPAYSILKDYNTVLRNDF